MLKTYKILKLASVLVQLQLHNGEQSKLALPHSHLERSPLQEYLMKIVKLLGSSSILLSMILIPSSKQILEEKEVFVVCLFLRSKLQLGTQHIYYVEAVHFVWVVFYP